MDSVSSAERAVKIALKIGADEAEAFVSKRNSILVEVKDGDISNESVRDIGGVGVRVISDGSVGFAYIDKLDDRYMQETVERAYQISKGSIKDPHAAFPQPKKPPTVHGIFDKKISDLQMDECVEKTKATLEAALGYDKRVRVISGRFVAGTGVDAVANSNGVEASAQGTAISVEVLTLARENGEVSSMAFDFDVSRRLDLDLETVGVNASRKAVEGLGAQGIESFEGTVLLDFLPSTELIGNTLAFAINSINIQTNASPLKDKIGEEIAQPSLNVVDDGLLEGGLGTRGFDDEGFPKQRTKVIEKGVLRSFLYNHYTANKEERESTGNASREIPTLGNPLFEEPPRVLPSNLIVEAGAKTWKRLKEEVDKGIFVGRFSGNVEYTNGNFSGVVKQGFLIEDGEFRHSLTGTMISGNAYEMLKHISGLSREVKDIKYFGSIRSPMIRIEDVKISGKA